MKSFRRWGLLFLWSATVLAQGPPGLKPSAPVLVLPKPQTISHDAYVAEVAQIQSLLAACRDQPSACDSRRVPDDASINTDTTIRWGWVRQTLDQAKDSKLDGRADLLTVAADRLSDEQAETVAPPPVPSDDDARKHAISVLSAPEFNRVQKNSYLAEKLAALSLFLGKLFEGTGKLLPRLWWIAPLLEYGTLILAAAGVILWVIRLNRQDRLRIDTGSRPPQAWQAESERWGERAQEEAARANWREAVHCLYWSAIVMLEGQRLWLQNRARTPREYIALLEPGSERQRLLRGLTGVFERIWYGLRPAAERDYTDARELLDRMRVG